MSHPFGDLITQHISRKHGLSQSKLAQGILQDPAVITDMCNGKRLSGPGARDRVVSIIRWFHQKQALSTQAEANALLQAAGFGALRAGIPEEQDLLDVLTPEPPAEAAAPASSQQTNIGTVQIIGQVVNPVISSAPTPSQILSNVPPPPGLLIGREADLSSIKRRLGIGDSQEHTALQVLTAMRGWPGVGKTTLAAALAHDPEIQRAFPDGVLWASLGQRPNIFAELAAWGRALGLPTLDVPTIEEAAARLRAILRTKRMLLIVDDVWEVAHAAPFRIGGSDCSLLITTRLPEVARAVATLPTDVYILGVLTEADALKLLRQLAPEVVAAEPELSRELVNDLEGLPLALQVAGRLLHTEASYGFSIADLVREIRVGARLIAAQAPADRSDLANETTPTVAALLKQSTDRLDPQTLDCFAYLGVFAPKPATFDTTAMAAVWEVADPKPTIRTLVDRGLLEPTAGRFWMHAILVTHAKSFLEEDADHAA